jgi:hypothetical protein
MIKPRAMANSAALLCLMFASAVEAQSCVGRPDFDACMARINSANSERLAEAQQQTLARYMRVYGPWVRKQYAAYRGPPMPFERYAYFMMMSANGTNVAGGLRAQQEQFRGIQGAHNTIQRGNDSYRQGMHTNSDTTSRIAERYDQGAVRGNVAQIDPNTGQKLWLPNAQPEGHPFTQGGQTYIRDQNGYYQWTGNGWRRMQSGR